MNEKDEYADSQCRDYGNTGCDTCDKRRAKQRHGDDLGHESPFPGLWLALRRNRVSEAHPAHWFERNLCKINRFITK